MHFVDYSIAMQEGYLESPVNRNNSNHDVAVGPMTGLDLTSIKCWEIVVAELSVLQPFSLVNESLARQNLVHYPRGPIACINDCGVTCGMTFLK